MADNLLDKERAYKAGLIKVPEAIEEAARMYRHLDGMRNKMIHLPKSKKTADTERVGDVYGSLAYLLYVMMRHKFGFYKPQDELKKELDSFKKEREAKLGRELDSKDYKTPLDTWNIKQHSPDFVTDGGNLSPYNTMEMLLKSRDNQHDMSVSNIEYEKAVETLENLNNGLSGYDAVKSDVLWDLNRKYGLGIRGSTKNQLESFFSLSPEERLRLVEKYRDDAKESFIKTHEENYDMKLPFKGEFNEYDDFDNLLYGIDMFNGVRTPKEPYDASMNTLGFDGYSLGERISDYLYYRNHENWPSISEIRADPIMYADHENERIRNIARMFLQ